MFKSSGKSSRLRPDLIRHTLIRSSVPLSTFIINCDVVMNCQICIIAPHKVAFITIIKNYSTWPPRVSMWGLKCFKAAPFSICSAGSPGHFCDLQSHRVKVACIAFVRFFSKWFQMIPQIHCLNRFKVAYFAFVHFFSRVSLHLIPQIDCLNRCKVAYIAFLQFCSSRMSFQIIFNNQYLLG